MTVTLAWEQSHEKPTINNSYNYKKKKKDYKLMNGWINEWMTYFEEDRVRGW